MEQRVSYGGLEGLFSLKGPKGILMVHGFCGSKDESLGLFSGLASRLQRVGYSTLRYDSVITEECDLDTKRDDFRKSLEYLAARTEKIGVVGFSLGATKAILEYDSRIRSMALLAPVLKPKEDMLERYKETGEYQEELRASKEMYDSLDVDLIPYINKVKCPVILVHSEHDPVIPVDSSEEMFRNFPYAQLHKIQFGGHSFRDGDDLSPRRVVYSNVLGWFSDTL